MSPNTRTIDNFIQFPDNRNFCCAFLYRYKPCVILKWLNNFNSVKNSKNGHCYPLLHCGKCCLFESIGRLEQSTFLRARQIEWQPTTIRNAIQTIWQFVSWLIGSELIGDTIKPKHKLRGRWLQNVNRVIGATGSSCSNSYAKIYALKFNETVLLVRDVQTI